MNSINSLFDQEIQLSHIVDKRNEEVEQWLRQLEKSRSKNFTKQLYDSIKVYCEQSFYYDYNRIQKDENGNEFFYLLKPRIRQRLI